MARSLSAAVVLGGLAPAVDGQYSLGASAVPAALRGCWALPEGLGPCEAGAESLLEFGLLHRKAVMSLHCGLSPPASQHVVRTTCYCPDGTGDCDRKRMTLCRVGEVWAEAVEASEAAGAGGVCASTCGYFTIGGGGSRGGELTWRQYQRTGDSQTCHVECPHWGDFEEEYALAPGSAKLEAVLRRRDCPAEAGSGAWGAGTWASMASLVTVATALLGTAAFGSRQCISRALDLLSGEARDLSSSLLPPRLDHYEGVDSEEETEQGAE